MGEEVKKKRKTCKKCKHPECSLAQGNIKERSMTDQEKWEKEFEKWFGDRDVIIDGFGWYKERSKDAYLQGRKDENKMRQEEIERLKGYEVRWWRLKDQLRRDREQGHLSGTARAWVLMQEFEEGK